MVSCAATAVKFVDKSAFWISIWFSKLASVDFLGGISVIFLGMAIGAFGADMRISIPEPLTISAPIPEWGEQNGIITEPFGLQVIPELDYCFFYQKKEGKKGNGDDERLQTNQS